MLSIITPTLQRESLIQCCASIDNQKYADWQHIVMVDCAVADYDLWDKIEHPQRQIHWCVEPHGDGGNTCRHNAWPFATGDWVAYMDDDNYYADDLVFADLEAVLAPLPLVVGMALFPITRLGQRFFCDPPRSCHVDTMNFLLRREFARWPLTDAYGSDGVLIDRLMEANVFYSAFPDFRPIAVLPKISFCK